MSGKTYAIIPVDDIVGVDFSQVDQEPDTVRKNKLEDKFIVKWTGETPSSISSISPQLFNHYEILAETKKEEWKTENV